MHAEYARRVVVVFEERFWAKVQRKSQEMCWEWVGHRHYKGYGMFKGMGGKLEKAHRVSYEMRHGRVPGDMHVLHRCDNPPCVNPDHLWAGTNAENVADREAKGRGGRLQGSLHWAAKLTEEQVIMMRRLHAEGAKQKDIVARFGVDKSRVSAIINRKIWRHI